ncbi:MMPL family protein [Symmachiella macrocystis]|uniref:MMPL family protein n=1 Tax=Symmachiella macrocystis TaxID=2527985 RepID=A0A5C6B8Z8_9PLAN|nr:MMPL family transporter [Symmachiella macrocystis]TWU06994.1 MMPL family protein [Symmachiella macrocystis]
MTPLGNPPLAPAHCTADGITAIEKRFRRRWLMASILMLCLVPFIGMATQQTMHSMLTLPSRWLPDSLPERQALERFIDEFESGNSVLLSWPGCAVDDPRLAEVAAAITALRSDASRTEEAAYFDETVNGYTALQELMEPPLSLSREAALSRLRGSLVGQDGDFSCMVVVLTEKGLYEREVSISVILREAERVTGIDEAQFLLAGPAVEGAFLDAEATFDANRLSIPSTIVSALLCWWCLRSWRYTAIVLCTALFGQGLVLASMHWSGVRMNALLIVLPTLVLVLTVSAGVHLVNYYYDAVRRFGVPGAADRAFQAGRRPCILAVVTTAMGLLSLCVSDIEPIVQFGLFAAGGVSVTIALLLYVLPGALVKWPAMVTPAMTVGDDGAPLPRLRRFDRILDAYAAGIQRYALPLCVLFLIGTFVAGYGLQNIRSSIAFDSLFPPESRISRNYEVLERDLGPLVPVEVILHFDDRNELPFSDRIDVVRRVGRAIGRVPHIAGTLSGATFSPKLTQDAPDEQQAMALAARLQLPIRRDLSEAALLPLVLPTAESHRAALAFSRPVTALTTVSLHHSTFREGAKFADARVVEVLSRPPRTSLAALQAFAHGALPSDATEPVMYAVDESPASFPTSQVPSVELLKSRALAVAEAEIRQQLIRRNYFYETDGRQSWRISARLPAMQELDYHQSLIDLRQVVDPVLAEVDAGQRPTISAEYTGVMPVVSKSQRILLHDLYSSFLTAFGLVALAMIFVLGKIRAGLIAMLPNVFPAAVVFGAMGWWNLPVGIGTMMTASVALGIAVDDTLHFLTWFRIETTRGHDRAEAVRLCFGHCARAMIQTTVICGMGMVVFALSGFVPTGRFAWLMLTLLSATLVGDLVFLPALLNSSAGKWFQSRT